MNIPYRSRTALLLAIMIVLPSILSTAQIPASSSSSIDLRPFIPIPHPLTLCLRSPGARHDLQLNFQQVNAIEITLDRVELPLWRMRDDSNEQRYQRAIPLLNSLNNELKQILSYRQQQRLREMMWQNQGISAIFDPDMSNLLEISNRQKQEIITHFEALKRALVQLDQNTNLSTEDRDAAQKTITQQTYQNIMQVLDSGQQENYTRLKGKPFDVSTLVFVAAKAPPFDKADPWLNSDPLNWDALKGNVVVLHFYTYRCGNCIANLPHYNDWYTQFTDQPVRIIGVHTPETKSETDIENVKKKIEETEIKYPVVIDNQRRIWNALANSVWPSIYLIDKKGFIRYWWYGELNWQGATGDTWILEKIQQLLNEEPFHKKAAP